MTHYQLRNYLLFLLKVNITAEYPGANNELLIKSVVIPLERAINGVPGMKYIASDAGNDGKLQYK
jgi:HAE1 family hydrophobic/amphiphilic exporter-1